MTHIAYAVLDLARTRCQHLNCFPRLFTSEEYASSTLYFKIKNDESDKMVRTQRETTTSLLQFVKFSCAWVSPCPRHGRFSDLPCIQAYSSCASSCCALCATTCSAVRGCLLKSAQVMISYMLKENTKT